MNITFLIGNGFDVGLGMNSRFKDFFPTYQKNSENKESIVKQLSDEIAKDKNYETWSDFEKAIGEYTEKFDSKTKNNLIQQLKDFQNEFIEYLKGQQKRLSFENETKISEKMTKGISKFYNNNNLSPDSKTAIESRYNQSANDVHTYNFVNFNYTDSLKRCIETIPNGIVCNRDVSGRKREDKIGKIVHVHGTLDSYPIIGVDNTGQIVNKELANDAKISRYIVKPTVNQRVRQGNDTKAQELIANSNIICIYGMSLGATDKKWWASIIKWLSDSQFSRHLVIFEFDDKFKSTNPYDLMEKEDDIIEKFNSYKNDATIDIEKLRSKIHIAVHKNIFQMNLTKPPYKKEETSPSRTIIGNGGLYPLVEGVSVGTKLFEDNQLDSLLGNSSLSRALDDSERLNYLFNDSSLSRVLGKSERLSDLLEVKSPVIEWDKIIDDKKHLLGI